MSVPSGRPIEYNRAGERPGGKTARLGASLRQTSTDKASKALDFGIAAIERFDDRQLTLDYISKNTGIPVTSLYHLFRNRDGFLMALRRHGCRLLTTAVMTCVTSDLGHAAEAGVSAYLEFVATRPRLYALMSGEDQSRADREPGAGMSMVAIALREVIASNMGLPFALAADVSATLLLTGRGMALSILNMPSPQPDSAHELSAAVLRASLGMLGGSARGPSAEASGLASSN
ncbi:TetR/AcrR family transcriptional regulator [Caulobacter sp. KR2-114]|uniref:TetR/AcrR family transcriptional regulator n=1 Tax=Caulobacter sp. KR2-114 TaxID=3400912 RepID=UPI003BFEC56D